MSEPTCPGCGVEWDHGTQPTNVWIMYKCDAVYREGVLYRVSKACLLRQLAQRDEKIAALEVRALKLEKALRRLADANPLRGRALHGNDKLPGCEEFYCGYNAGVDTQLAFSSEIARKALEEVGHE